MGKKKSKAKSNPKMLRKSAQNGASSSGSQPHMPQIQKEAQVYFGKSAIAKGNGIINKGNNAIHAVRWLFENKDACRLSARCHCCK